MEDSEARDSVACSSRKKTGAADRSKDQQATDKCRLSKMNRPPRQAQTQTPRREICKSAGARVSRRSVSDDDAPSATQSKCSFHKADTSAAPLRSRSGYLAWA